MISGYRLMWLLVMFDLPVLTSLDRKNYRDFHDFLLDDGYARMQFSVYARPCATDENTQVHLDRIVDKLPPDGEVRILKLTDKQWTRTLIFRQANAEKPEGAPEQLVFFDSDLQPLVDEQGDEEVEHRLRVGASDSKLPPPRGARKKPSKSKRPRKDAPPGFDFFD